MSAAPCKFGAKCNRKDTCKFTHPEAKQQTCRFFQRGECKNADCKFAHVLDKTPAAKSMGGNLSRLGRNLGKISSVLKAYETIATTTGSSLDPKAESATKAVEEIRAEIVRLVGRSTALLKLMGHEESASEGDEATE